MEIATQQDNITALCGHITRFTASRQLGKRFDLDANGNLKKTTLGEMVAGAYEVLTFRTVREFADLLGATGTDQAITGSTPKPGVASTGRICRKDDLKDNPGTIARSKAYFGFAEAPGVMTLDYDPQPGEAPLSRDELVDILLDAAPALADAGMVWVPSGSSHIRTTTGAELQGLRGQRVYILAKTAAEIPAACDALADRMWLAGRGRVVISQAGAKLMRHTFDDSMRQPARLDFAGGAVLGSGLTSARGEPVIIRHGGFADLGAALPPISPKDRARVEALRRDARTKAEPEARRVREAHTAATALDLAKQLIETGTPPAEAHERAEQVMRAAHGDVLMGDFRVMFEDGTTATVGEILDNRDRHHGRITRDPLEPGYQSGKATGKLFLYGAVPNLYSFAHGGRTFRLQRQPARVVLASGRSQAAATEIISKLADDGDIFQRGGHPVRVVAGRAVAVKNKAAVAWLIEARMAMFRTTERGDVPADLPPAVAERVMEGIGQEGESLGIRPLTAVVGHPYATPVGLVDTVGYSPYTRAYADFDPTELDTVPTAPTRAELVAALRTLWGPWSAFPFATEHDRAAMLAGIFTLMCRPGLDIAPGVLFEAPCQSSGKTLAAESLSALVLGRVTPVIPFSGGTDDEMRKQIVTEAIEGSPVIVLDNVIGYFDSSVLASLMTGAALKARILGSNENFTGEPRLTPILTGNNCSFGADFATRLLRVRLDARTDKPMTRKFAWHPTRRVLADRWELIRAYTCLMRGFFGSGAPRGQGSTRFGEWTALVASAVEWMRDTGLTEAAGLGTVGDPCFSLSGASVQVVDMKTDGFRRLAAAMVPVWGSRAFEARELLGALTGYTPDETTRDIRDALESMMPDRWKPSANNIGRLLQSWRDNVAGGVVLRVEDRNGRTSLFRWCESVA